MEHGTTIRNLYASPGVPERSLLRRVLDPFEKNGTLHYDTQDIIFTAEGWVLRGLVRPLSARNISRKWEVCEIPETWFRGERRYVRRTWVRERGVRRHAVTVQSNVNAQEAHLLDSDGLVWDAVLNRKGSLVHIPRSERRPLVQDEGIPIWVRS